MAAFALTSLLRLPVLLVAIGLLIASSCILTVAANTISSSSSYRATIDVTMHNDESIIEWNGIMYHRASSAVPSIAPSSVTPSLLLSTTSLLSSTLVGHEESEDEWMSPKTGEFWMYVSIILGLVALAGTMSGLTVGLLSVSALEISILRNNPESDPAKRRYAEKLAGLIAPERHHLLLVTLLLINAACMESVPLFLDRVVPPWLAIILSVSFVLIFGEILPQALCSANPLKIGAALSPLVWFFMMFTYPISFPIAKLLDRVLGHDGGSHFLSGRGQMKALLSLQEEAHVLQSNETKIMRAVLGLTSKKVMDEMTPFDKCFSMSTDETLDRTKLKHILNAGHSRVPLYRGAKHNIRSILLTKSLIVVNPDRKMCVAELPSAFLRPPIWVSPDAELLPLLDELLCGKLHLALVTNQLAEVDEALRSERDIPDSVQVLGFITLADIVEAMLDAEILDEFDPEASLPVPGTADVVERSPALGPMAPLGTPSPKLEAMSSPLSGVGSVRLAMPTSSHLMKISSPRHRTHSSAASTRTKSSHAHSTTASIAGPPSLLLGATATTVTNERKSSDADEGSAAGSWAGDDSSVPRIRPTIITSGTSAPGGGIMGSSSSPRVVGRLQRDLSTVHDNDDDDEFEPAHGEPQLPPPSLRTTGRLFGGLLTGIATLGERRVQRMASQKSLFSPTAASASSQLTSIGTYGGNGVPSTPSGRTATTAAAGAHAAMIIATPRATGNASSRDDYGGMATSGTTPQLTIVPPSTPLLPSTATAAAASRPVAVTASTPLLRSIQ